MKIPNEIVIGEIYLYPYYYNSKNIPFRPCRILGESKSDSRSFKVEWLCDPDNSRPVFKNPKYFRVLPKNWFDKEISKIDSEIFRLYDKRRFYASIGKED